jgi:hypothetical protein
VTGCGRKAIIGSPTTVVVATFEVRAKTSRSRGLHGAHMATWGKTKTHHVVKEGFVISEGAMRSWRLHKGCGSGIYQGCAERLRVSIISRPIDSLASPYLFYVTPGTKADVLHEKGTQRRSGTLCFVVRAHSLPTRFLLFPCTTAWHHEAVAWHLCHRGCPDAGLFNPNADAPSIPRHTYSTPSIRIQDT